jgi:hypothetical protein
MVAEYIWAGTQQHVRSFTLPKRRESWSIYMTLGHACLRDIHERHLDKCDGQFSDSDSFIDRLIDLGPRFIIIDCSLWPTTTLPHVAHPAMNPSRNPWKYKAYRQSIFRGSIYYITAIWIVIVHNKRWTFVDNADRPDRSAANSIHL